MIVAIIAWQFIPFHTLLYAVGRRQIPQVLYEAATLDGASPARMFWRVTLPQLRYTIVTSSILMIVGSLTYFDIIYIMTDGGPGYTTRVLSLDMYNAAFLQDQYGYASVLAVLLGVIGIAVARRPGQVHRLRLHGQPAGGSGMNGLRAPGGVAALRRCATVWLVIVHRAAVLHDPRQLPDPGHLPDRQSVGAHGRPVGRPYSTVFAAGLGRYLVNSVILTAACIVLTLTFSPGRGVPHRPAVPRGRRAPRSRHAASAWPSRSRPSSCRSTCSSTRCTCTTRCSR